VDVPDKHPDYRKQEPKSPKSGDRGGIAVVDVHLADLVGHHEHRHGIEDESQDQVQHAPDAVLAVRLQLLTVLVGPHEHPYSECHDGEQNHKAL